MKLFFLLRGWFAARPKKEGGGLFYEKALIPPLHYQIPPLSACQGRRREGGSSGYRLRLPPPTLPPFLSRDQGSRGGGRRKREGK